MKEKINVIIPARAGSKGITDKNLQTVNKISLVERSIMHARALQESFETTIWISTDIKEIIQSFSQEEGIRIHKRASSLCGDKVLTYDVVKDLILKEELDNDQIIVLYQPTSPFRDVKESEKAINMIINNNYWNSSVSLTKIRSSHPFRMKRLASNGECFDYIDQGFEDMRPRQSLPEVYIRSGSFYISKISLIRSVGHLLPKPTFGIIHSDEKYEINIDNMSDLIKANKYNDN